MLIELKGTIVVEGFPETIFTTSCKSELYMIYKFSDFLQLNYSQLEQFIENNEELSKNEILERCTGEINYDILQSLKELVFSKIGKTAAGELYLV
ncbi:MAG: hypothetical protein JWQ09_5926 [Segetibacter sp.]|nr:hypothetical protein [Segetibacter sp.]